jgi:hypothetical protein
MSGTPLGQSRDNTCSAEQTLSRQPGTLKALAMKVLNPTVPLSPSVDVGQVGQQPETGEKAGTSVGQSRDSDELYLSMRRLEAADIRIAMFVTEIDAWLQVTDREVRNNAEAQQAINDGGVIYTPSDMYCYVQLDRYQRRMLNDFKRQFGGTVAWKAAQK